MLPQSTLTIAAPIQPVQGALAALREVLAEIGRDPAANPLVPFGELTGLHYGRFVILEAAVDPATGRTIPGSLALNCCFDGPAGLFLRQLTAKAGAGLRAVFQHCSGAPAPGGDRVLLTWLRRHRIPTQTFYVNSLGRTVPQILGEAQLRERIERFLDREGGATTPSDVRQAIQRFVRRQEDLAWARRPEPPLPLAWRLRDGLHRIGGLAMGLLVGLLALPVVPFFLVLLRLSEINAPHPRQDPHFRLSQFDRRHLAVDEDFFIQNQFSVLGFIKPGMFRYATLRTILAVADFVVHHFFREGDLGTVRLLNLHGVDTIHFANWIVVDQGRRVLFMSNYDFNLEDYMNDFINKVAWGLNLIFGHGVNYPRTDWMVLGGARDEQVYKAVLRKYQIRTQVWFCAYPDLSAITIQRNARLRAGLFVDLDPAAERAWLALL
jgi:hypothetical protein